MRARAALAAVLALAASGGPAAAAPPDAIRVGGPSAPSEAKVAIVGSARDLAGKRYLVRALGGGRVVERGRLRAVPGKADPWPHAFGAALGELVPGRYRVEVGRLRSRPWKVREEGSLGALREILRFFAANRDGGEPSPVHGLSHLHDAVIHPDAPAHAGEAIAISGGWMDAGDMLHFTQTTAYSAALLQAGARLDPADAGTLNAEADVGIRWLVAAHPFPDAFVAQVGDARDHELGFRDPVSDDARALPGIGARFAYVLGPDRIGGDLGGKASAALAMAARRLGSPPLLAAAEQWYAAGKASGAPAPALADAGYPGFAGDFYVADGWRDSLAAGAVELFRATGDPAYLEDLKAYLRSPDSEADGVIQVVDDFASFAAADACGLLGEAPLDDPEARSLACGLVRENGAIAVRQGRSNAFGMPGYFSWGTTAPSGGAGALAAMAAGAPGGLRRGCETAAGARDYLVGRNSFGASFVAGFGPRSPRTPHHWAFKADPGGVPVGAVVGGPAPLAQIRDQGFRVKGPLQSRFAGYEDERADYVTSEPALDYASSSVLLLAALDAYC